MAKNWETIETIYTLKNKPETLAEQRRKTKIFNKLMTTPTLSAVDLKKKSTELFNENKIKEDNLIQAYDDKRLKSEKAIKQAIRIKKERAKRQNSAKQDTEKVSVNNETTDNPV